MANTIRDSKIPRKVEASGFSHPGQVREENEDAIGIFLEDKLFLVADGMGGRAAGDVAARLAVEQVELFFRTFRADPRQPWPFSLNKHVSLGANLLRVGMQVANQKIRESAAANPAQYRMAATMAALAIGQTHLIAAHVGDARIYRIRKGVLRRITADHSLFEELRAARPDISGDELERIAPRNVVTRALGTKEEVDPTVYTNRFASGDLYLLCSDGLWGSVSDDQITALVDAHQGDLETACHALTDAANAAGGPDNITALLVRVE